MRKIIFIFLLSCSTVLFGQTNLDQIRLNYITAVSNKNLCKQMIDELQKKTDQPLMLGYLGGFHAIWANHVVNPFSKLKTFNKGKDNLEKAIKLDANNPELRYLRLSIQKNVPAILGYKENVNEDINFLKLNKNKIDSEVVLKNVESLLKP